MTPHGPDTGANQPNEKHRTHPHTTHTVHSPLQLASGSQCVHVSLCMTGAFVGASAAPIHNNPVFFDQGLAFMFETSYLLKPTLQARTSAGGTVPLDERYAESWLPLPKRFDPTAVPHDVDDVEGKTANLLAWRAKAEAEAAAAAK